MNKAQTPTGRRSKERVIGRLSVTYLRMVILLR